jgi:hypothetical protein
MSQPTHVIAAALSAAVLGLAGCATGSQGSPGSPPAMPSSGAAANPAPAALSAGSPCGESQYLLDTVHSLQQGQIPTDIRGTSQRMSDFARSAPEEIRHAAKGVTGPAILGMYHNELLGELTTPDVNNDLQVLDSWRKANC